MQIKKPVSNVTTCIHNRADKEKSIIETETVELNPQKKPCNNAGY